MKSNPLTVSAKDEGKEEEEENALEAQAFIEKMQKELIETKKILEKETKKLQESSKIIISEKKKTKIEQTEQTQKPAGIFFFNP